MSVLKFALGIKTVQALVSVICQLSYLVSKADVNDPTMGPQAKALFALNIMFSLASAMYGIMVLFTKQQMLLSLQSERPCDMSAARRPMTTSDDDIVEFVDLYDDDHGAEPKNNTMWSNRIEVRASSPMYAEVVQRLERRVEALAQEASDLTAISEDLAKKLQKNKSD
jgi:hypothetical protein